MSVVCQLEIMHGDEGVYGLLDVVELKKRHLVVLWKELETLDLKAGLGERLA